MSGGTAGAHAGAARVTTVADARNEAASAAGRSADNSFVNQRNSPIGVSVGHAIADLPTRSFGGASLPPLYGTSIGGLELPPSIICLFALHCNPFHGLRSLTLLCSPFCEPRARH